jgi:hypothetical protein
MVKLKMLDNQSCWKRSVEKRNRDVVERMLSGSRIQEPGNIGLYKRQPSVNHKTLALADRI